MLPNAPVDSQDCSQPGLVSFLSFCSKCCVIHNINKTLHLLCILVHTCVLMKIKFFIKMFGIYFSVNTSKLKCIKQHNCSTKAVLSKSENALNIGLLKKTTEGIQSIEVQITQHLSCSSNAVFRGLMYLLVVPLFSLSHIYFLRDWSMDRGHRFSH